MEADSDIELDYSPEEVKVVIRHWHSLPEGFTQKMDIRSVFPLLGGEWVDVFNLYASGSTLEEIARYWIGIHVGRFKHSDRYRGKAVVNQLINRILWLMTLRRK